MLKYNSRHNLSLLIRFTGPICLLSSFLLITTQIIGIFTDHSSIHSFWLIIYSIFNLLAFFLLLIALFGIYIFQSSANGKFGFISFSIAVLGTMLIVGDAWFEAFVVPFISDVAPIVEKTSPSGMLIIGAVFTFSTFCIGWLLFGISCYKTRIIPRYISFLLCIGGIFGFKALTIPYLGFLAIPIGILGYWMIKNSSTIVVSED
jgi:hypothetical protein